MGIFSLGGLLEGLPESLQLLVVGLIVSYRLVIILLVTNHSKKLFFLEKTPSPPVDVILLQMFCERYISILIIFMFSFYRYSISLLF